MEGEDEEEVLISEPAPPPGPPSCCCGFTSVELLFIIVITIVSIGVEFSIDIPASLEDAISKYYNLDQYDFSLFYTCYFFPSIILNIFGGFLIDKFMGVRSSTILYNVVAAVGLVLFVLGSVLRLFWLMIVGRLIFGLGNEMSSNVCMSYCTFTYFNQSSVNLMFSLTDNFSYLGTVAVFQLAPFLFSVFSESNIPYQSLNYILIICSSTYILTGCLSVWVSFMGSGEGSLVPTDNTSETSQPSQITLHDIIRFPLIFWLLCLAYCCFMNANFTFETFSQGIFTSDMFKLSVEEASNAVTIMNLVKIGLSVPLSLVVDRTGNNILFVVVSMMLCAVSYTMFLCTTLHPYIVMGLLGASYSLTGSAIWAMFAYPISKQLRGSCYGIVSAVYGLSQTVSPSIVGNLIDKFGYMAAMYFFLANSFVAVLASGITWTLDCKSGGLLSMTPTQRILIENQFERLRNDAEPENQDFDFQLPSSDNSA